MAALPAPGLPPRRDEVRPGPARNLPRIAEVATTIHAPGDVNGDTLVDVRDLFYLINFLFAHGPSPLGPADLNNDGRVDVADVLYLVNSLFAGGPAPIPDTQPPSIYYTDPYYGAPGVPRNVVGRMEFSEPMDPATLNADNIRLWDITRDLPVPCTVEAEPGGLVANVIPLEVLAGGRTYGFLPNFAALTDLAGNPVDPDNVYTDGLGRIPFTAGFTRDETPPAIVGSLFPEEGAADLPTNTAFMIRFSEVVGDIGLPSAFTVDGHPAELAIQYEIEKTARVRFAAPFAPNSAHTLVVNGLRDLAGNVMTDPWELHFTTGASPDTAPSTGTWNTPYGSVTRDFRPRLHFDKPVLPESLEIESSPAVAGEVVLDAARTTGMFIPRSSLPPQNVRFYAQAMDESGHVLFPYRLLVSVSLAPPVAISPPVVSPPDGSTDVPLNARIAIVGSADPTTWSAISLWSAGTPVPITVTWQVGDLVVIPSSPLSQGTTYTVETAGLVDTLGRPYPAVSSSFTTRLDSAPDLTPPSVVASVPADGATSVDPATPVIVTFSEPLAATGGSVLLTYTTGFGVAAWPGHLERKGTSVAYVPALPLPGGTTFTVTAAQLADLCGNTLAAGATFSFTTSGAVDTSPPAVTAVDVIPNGHWCGSVLLYFSKPIAPIATVPTGSCSPSLAVLYYDGYRAGAVPCSSVRTFGGLSLRIDCASPYGPSAVVLTSNITDRDGHPADPTLVFPFDAGTRPVYGAETTYRPEDGATGVSRTTPILIFASHDFDPDSLAGIVITADSNIIDGTLSSSDRTILFTPNAPLPGGSLVEVFVTSGLRLVDAAVLIPAYTSFRVAPSPSASAVVVAATPAEGEDVPTNARLRVRYSRALYAGSVSAGSVALTAAEVAVSGSASLEGGDTVVFTPANPLAGGVSHALSIEGLKDLDGGAAAPFTRQFTTGSGVVSSPPSVAVVTPPDESTLIGTNARMSLVFTRRLDPLTVDASSVTLNDTTGPIAARISALGDHVQLAPLLPLAPGMVHMLSANSVADEAGNEAAPFSASFTTSSGNDAATAQFTSVGVDIPPNAPLEIATNLPLAAGRLSPGDVAISPPVAGFLSFSGDQRVLRFVPSSGWTPSTASALTVGVLSGNRFLTPFRTVADQPSYPGWSYDPITVTIGAAVQTTAPPSLTSVNPPDGATHVARDTNVVLTFAEPISADVLSHVILSGPDGKVADRVSVGRSTLWVTPLLPLAANSTYTLTLDGLTSLLGIPLPAPVALSFTTGPSFSF